MKLDRVYTRPYEDERNQSLLYCMSDRSINNHDVALVTLYHGHHHYRMQRDHNDLAVETDGFLVDLERSCSYLH